jgi:hypothetical protein
MVQRPIGTGAARALHSWSDTYRAVEEVSVDLVGEPGVEVLA